MTNSKHDDPTTPTADRPPEGGSLRPDQFARYDAELMNGRRAYLAGLPRSTNPHHIGTEFREWWQEGYDQ